MGANSIVSRDRRMPIMSHQQNGFKNTKRISNTIHLVTNKPIDGWYKKYFYEIFFRNSIINCVTQLLVACERRRISGCRFSLLEPVTAGNTSAFAGYVTSGQEDILNLNWIRQITSECNVKTSDYRNSEEVTLLHVFNLLY